MRTRCLRSTLTVLLLAGSFPACERPAGKPIDDERLRGFAGRAAGYNLLLVTLDTVRADRLGCYGYSGATTPAIDRLAGNGIRFAQATAPAPITLPSHATLMTGLQVPTHGVRNNGTYRLAADRTTLAERLRDAGYDTGAFVGAFVLDARYGLDQGFDHYDDEVNPEGASASSGGFQERTADRVTGAALRWLGGKGAEGEPFFAWLHYFDAHAPYAPPARHAKRHSGRPYDGEISFVDAELGRILEHLRDRAIADRTLVVVTADHGEGLGEHGEQTHSLLIYESTMRVPLIVANAAIFEEAWVVDDRLAGLVDLVPTVLGLLGLGGAEETEGVDLLAFSGDRSRSLYIESLVPLLNYGWAPLTGLRRLDDKYIHSPKPEYYDLGETPLEENDRYAGSAAAAALAEELAARLSRWPPVDGLEEPEIDAEAAEKLAALGYVRSTLRPELPGARKNPRDMLPIWNRISQAEMLSGQGKNEQALAMMQEVLDEDPGDARAWYTVSLIHRRLNRFDEAEVAVRRALDHGPTSEGYLRLAQFLLARKSHVEFEAAIEQARALEPDNGAIDITLGDRLALAGRFSEALPFFERALEIDPVRSGSLARQKIAAIESRLKPSK